MSMLRIRVDQRKGSGGGDANCSGIPVTYLSNREE